MRTEPQSERPAELTVACVQLCSGRDQEQNLERVRKLLARAAEQGAELVLLPENFALMGADEAAKRAHAGASAVVIDFLQQQACKHGMAIIGGGMLMQGEGGRIRNASLVLLKDGRVGAVYDKMHLFDVDVRGESYRESDLVEAGDKPVCFDLAGFRIGLSICYDLRFPELYRHYATLGCHLLTLPAAFTEATGRDHWLPLLQARAIENQCFVLAAGQVGEHPDGRRTWGHSMIIDPWGRVLGELAEGEGVICAQLSMNDLTRLRESIPVMAHRRL